MDRKLGEPPNSYSAKIQVFINNCLTNIFNINWKDKITNKELWNMAEQYSMETTITRRKWTWIGHTMRKAGSSITKKTLRWTPSVVETEEDQRTHKRGQLRRSWETWNWAGAKQRARHKIGRVAEYRRRPVLRQELKSKEEEVVFCQCFGVLLMFKACFHVLCARLI